LLADRWSYALVVLTAVGTFLMLNGMQFIATSTSARASQFLWHTLLTGAAGVIAVLVGYSSTTASTAAPPSLQHALSGVLIGVAFVFWMPFISHAAWQLFTARHKSVARAALVVTRGAAVAAVGTTFGAAVASYVTMSKGLVGVSGVAVSGLVYPGMVWLLRVAQRRLFHSKVSSSTSDLDFAGVIALNFEIFSSTPQFYLLSTYVRVRVRVGSRRARRTLSRYVASRRVASRRVASRRVAPMGWACLSSQTYVTPALAHTLALALVSLLPALAGRAALAHAQDRRYEPVFRLGRAQLPSRVGRRAHLCSRVAARGHPAAPGAGGTRRERGTDAPARATRQRRPQPTNLRGHTWRP
jgi:hypothetical protein